MSDEPDLSAENELMRKLMAAFGDDAMNGLDDDFDDKVSDEFLDEMEQSNLGELLPDDEPTPLPNSLEISGDESHRTQWMKQLCSAIYFPANDSQSSASTQHVVFSVGEFNFGIQLDSVFEIGRCPKVTQLPCTPSWLRGVANFRGEVHSITDFRNLVRLAGQRPAVGEMVVLIRSSRTEATTALAVDRVVGIQKLEQLETSLPNNEQFSRITSGVAQHESSTVILLDSELLFEAAELKATPA